MCFSAQADLVGGTVVALLGVDALRHVRQRREIAIAALPLLLGAHQLVETFVWWGLQGHVAEQVGEVATWIYLLIAFVVLPLYLPFAIWRMELTASRRRLIAPLMGVGIAVSAVLLLAMVEGPVSAALESNHIAYDTGITYGGIIVLAYVIVTCGPLLLSGYRYVVAFGMVNLVAVVVLAMLARSGFASLWCAWAAVTSGMIVLHLRHEPRRSQDRRPATVSIAS